MKKLSSIFQPLPAWMAILSLVIVITVGLLIRVTSIVYLVYNLGSFAVGLFLYQRYPILYVGFTWWLWFIGPFIKRLLDYQNGSTMPGAWYLIPALVTSISIMTLIRYFPKCYKQEGLPYVLGIGAVLYGFAIELVQQPVSIRGITVLLSWLPPVIFGFHLFASWQQYPSYRRNLQRVFLYGTLVMGAYGIWQFFGQLPWDIFWVQDRCRCFTNRLWSTMTTPFTFGVFMSGSLILLFINQTFLKLPTAVIGYLSFLLTLSRSAWLSLLFSLFLLLPSLKVNLQKRIVVSGFIMLLCCLPLINTPAFSEIIGSRITTFNNLESDDSYNARLTNYQNNIERAAFEFIGKGLTATIETDEFYSPNDAGILYIVIALGWLGTVPFLGGIALLFFNLFNSKNYLDSFIIALRSIATSVFILALIGLPGVIASEGMMLVWGFLGMAMGGKKYNQYKQDLLLENKN